MLAAMKRRSAVLCLLFTFLLVPAFLADGAAAKAKPKPTPTTAKPKPKPTPTTARPTPSTIPAPRKYAGSGDNVLPIQKPAAGPVTATITYTGTSNFAVWAEDAQLRHIDLLVNTIGNYGGTVAIDFTGRTSTAVLEIEADGPWTIELRSPLAARQFTTTISGTGDDVVNYRGGARPATFTHNGESNFAVWHYATSGRDLLVNTIGVYSGTRPLRGAGFLVIEADGAWTVK